MIRVKLKPLSVNEAWQGRRYKTKEYKRFERYMLYLLPVTYTVPKTGQLEVKYRFGFSNAMSDIDNPVKVVQDVLQKRYGFNDSRIYRSVVEKEIVAKGAEYIEFEINVI